MVPVRYKMAVNSTIVPLDQGVGGWGYGGCGGGGEIGCVGGWVCEG